MIGALNEAYTFLYNWLWGSEAVTAFAPYADSITMFIALFIVCGMMFFCFKLVTSIIRLVFYMFRE